MLVAWTWCGVLSGIEEKRSKTKKEELVSCCCSLEPRVGEDEEVKDSPEFLAGATACTEVLIIS